MNSISPAQAQKDGILGALGPDADRPKKPDAKAGADTDQQAEEGLGAHPVSHSAFTPPHEFISFVLMVWRKEPSDNPSNAFGVEKHVDGDDYHEKKCSDHTDEVDGICEQQRSQVYRGGLYPVHHPVDFIAGVKRQIQRFEAGFPAANMLPDGIGVIGKVVHQLLKLIDRRWDDQDEEDDNDGQQ